MIGFLNGIKNPIYLALVYSAASGCAAIGPKANVTLMQDEVKTSKVENIVVPYATGIDSTGNTGKALLSTAMKAYSQRAKPVAMISPLLNAVPGLPKGLDGTFLASYQMEFVKAVEQYRKDGKKPSQLKVPESAALKPKGGLKGLKDFFNPIQSEMGNLTALNQSLQNGSSQEILASAEKTKNLLPYLHTASSTLMVKLKANYVLLSHVVGDEKAWQSGTEVELVTALVNFKTGKIRYFANVKAKKSSIPIPYMAQLGSMSQSIFDSVKEKDPLQEKSNNSAHQKDLKTKDKVAQK